MQSNQLLKELFGSVNLLVGITGSFAALGIPQYLIAFSQVFKDVKVMMTPAACQFIPHQSIQYICKDVYIDSEKSAHQMGHVELANWADLCMVLPATANTLAHVAHGFADNFLTLTLLCYAKHILFFPNMNRLMWLKEAVQRNVSQLKADGHIICSPVEVEAFEQATRSIKKNFCMPPLLEVLEHSANYLINSKEHLGSQYEEK